MKNKFLHIIFVFGLISNLNAQVYPVQAFVQLTPPYTGYLPDYADPFSEQMKIILTLNDFSVPSYTVKIKLSITGSGFSMQTKPFAILPAIELTPGVPLQISGSELAFYLSSTNLDFTGISLAEYETKKVLPEGMYSVCVQVLDYYSASNLVLANSSCASAWFTLQQPPLLNTPFCGTTITPTDPQMVLFNWSPLSMTWAGAITSTEYEFSLYEIRPDGANPNIVITTTIPIYTTITSQTFISYGMTEPPLQVGMSYVWRIRAIDIGGRDAFVNDGYSQPCTFTYGSIAGTIAGNVSLTLATTGTGSRQGLANWNASATFTHYTVEVRKTGLSGAVWFPYNSTTGILRVNDLEPLTQYEAHVKGHNGSFESEYSNTATFTTLSLPDYACNSVSVPPVESGVGPLQNLIIGSIVSTGQFEMLVTQVESHLGAGLFSGLGKVNVPFMFLNFNVHFTNIYIDENMHMQTGKLVVLTEGIDQWAAGASDNTYNYVDPDYYYLGDADSVIVSGNSITIFGDGGSVTINYPGGNYAIEDENGDQWIIYADGSVHYQPVVPHIELTGDEKLIYRRAMKLVREEHKKSLVEQRKIDYQNSLTNVGTKLQSTTGKNYLNADTASIEGFMIVKEVASGTEISNYSEVNDFNDKRKQYYLSKQLNSMAKQNFSTGEYDFLANKTFVDGIPSYLYIRQNLGTLTIEEMIEKVKTAIVNLAQNTINDNY